MANAFWSNTIWYILLGITTIIELAFIVGKVNDRKFAASIFIIISGITFAMDATFCCIFRSYDYFPMIFPNSLMNDDLVGNLFSQFSITATALLLAVYHAKYRWYIVSAIVYCGIAELFLMLGIYQHHWYRTWMTFFVTLFIFLLTKYLFETDFLYSNKVRRSIFMIFGLCTLHMPTIFWFFLSTGIVKANEAILSSEIRSTAIVCIVNLLLLSSVCIIAFFSTWRWWAKALMLSMLYGAIYLADKGNLLHIKDGWFAVFASIDIWGMYGFVWILNRVVPLPLRRKTD